MEHTPQRQNKRSPRKPSRSHLRFSVRLSENTDPKCFRDASIQAKSSPQENELQTCLVNSAKNCTTTTMKVMEGKGPKTKKMQAKEH